MLFTFLLFWLRTRLTTTRYLQKFLRRRKAVRVEKEANKKVEKISMTEKVTKQFPSSDSYWSPCDHVLEEKFLIKTDRIGLLTVFVQGKVSTISFRTPVFLTVHDVGSNHAQFHTFVEHPSMKKINERSVFLHIEIPGQEFDCPDLPVDFQFPSMQEIAEELIYVLNYFKIMYVVTIGEGAGANILARFAMAFPDRVLGNVLIHCTGSEAGVMEYFSEKIASWKLPSLIPTAEQYLAFHKFGLLIEQQMEIAEDKNKILQEYTKKVKSRINQHNQRLFVESFLNRSDLTNLLREKMKVDTLLVTGALSSHCYAVHEMHTHMDPKWTTLLKLDDMRDVIIEAPHRLAHNVLLFSQGLGLLSALSICKQSLFT